MTFKDHPAWVVAGISAVLVTARLLVVARFDVNTAATILAVSGTSTAVVGTLLSLLPFAVVLLSLLFAVIVFVDETLLVISAFAGRLLLVLSLGATLCLSPAPLALGTVAVVAVLAAIGSYARRRHPDVRLREVVMSSRLLRVQVTALVLVLALAPIVLQRAWLPLESVTLTDGRVLVAYVLGNADGDLALMNDANRTVTFVAPDKVEQRSICSGTRAAGGIASRAPRIQLGGSLLAGLLWEDAPGYPACPTPSEV